jgi:hypothetical protein
MKRKTILILAVVVLAAVFSFEACKKADATTYTVTVLVSDGVSGIPAAGAYTLVSGSEMQYSFTLNAGYSKLTVLFDGSSAAASGTLTIYKDCTLQAYADDHFQCGLTVSVSDGVSGTPAAGTSNYPQGTLINYSYALADGYYDLSVTLDNVVVESSGTITMSADHTLKASATAGKKVPGTWLLSEIYDDGSSFKVTAAFSGKYAEGTVTDSDGGSGTYTYVGSTVGFNLAFPNVTYEYTGTFSDDNTMSGTCKRYQTAATVISGTWMAARKTTATASGNPALAGERTAKGDVAPRLKK